MGIFTGTTENPENGITADINYTVSKMSDLNLLGQDAIRALGISLDNILQTGLTMKSIKQQRSHVSTAAPDKQLQSDCHKLCDEFPDLFKNELGCLKDFELEVKFKPDAKPVFCKPRPVPFAIRDDLSKGYDEGIAKGVWKPVQFNDYGTPVVPTAKRYFLGNSSQRSRSAGITQQGSTIN